MKASIKLSITEDNGDGFFDNTLDYSNLSRADVVELEGLLLGFMNVLLDVGKKKAAEKAKPKNGI
jgi:hypothetical protein